jgi:threonyl-tRNA synthetase
LEESGKNFAVAEGDGAFYGPKIDIIMKDALGRDWQMGTIQLDFQQPRRFDLGYIAEDGQKRPPIAIHRVIYGSLERFIGLLIEHTAGSLPTWLSPVQVAILPISDKHLDYANSVKEQLQMALPDLRIELDDRAESVGKKIREASMQKVPYQIIVGDKEKEAHQISVRGRGDEDLGSLSVGEFTTRLFTEISQRKS